MNQQDHDARSLAWHRHVVARMRDDPALLDKAHAILAHWKSLGPRPNRDYLAAWQAALTLGMDAVEQLASDESEHGNALRQCSPISSVLSRERWAFRKDWSQQHATRKP